MHGCHWASPLEELASLFPWSLAPCLHAGTNPAIYRAVQPRLHSTQNGQHSFIAGFGLSRTAGAFAYGLFACGPRAHLLDGVPARARGRRHAGDAHGGSGPRPQPRQTTPRPRIEDLRWLGIRWQEGPDKGGPFAPYVQSKRRALYLAAWRRLLRRGCLFPCRCSRKDLETALGAPHERVQTASGAGKFDIAGRRTALPRHLPSLYGPRAAASRPHGERHRNARTESTGASAFPTAR